MLPIRTNKYLLNIRLALFSFFSCLFFLLLSWISTFNWASSVWDKISATLRISLHSSHPRTYLQASLQRTSWASLLSCGSFRSPLLPIPSSWCSCAQRTSSICLAFYRLVSVHWRPETPHCWPIARKFQTNYLSGLGAFGSVSSEPQATNLTWGSDMEFLLTIVIVFSAKLLFSMSLLIIWIVASLELLRDLSRRSIVQGSGGEGSGVLSGVSSDGEGGNGGGFVEAQILLSLFSASLPSAILRINSIPSNVALPELFTTSISSSSQAKLAANSEIEPE